MLLTKPKPAERTQHQGKAKLEPAASPGVARAMPNGRAEQRAEETVAGLPWRTFEAPLGEPHWRDWLRQINGCEPACSTHKGCVPTACGS